MECGARVMYSPWLMVALLAVLLCGATAQTCSTARTCSECLDADASCKWCADQTEVWRQSSRCQPSFTAAKSCAVVINPASEISLASDKAFADEVQVRPQLLTAKLRPGDSVNFTARVRPSRNYPLDVYYLMDHSFSMADDLENMKLFASSIAQSIRNLTTGYRLGFGSFVDKPAMPFIMTTTDGVTGQQTLKPCTICKRPYAFHNSLPLNNNASKFSGAVSADIISGNFDGPEGAFDAMIQVAVCTPEIGWRDSARRVLLIATDAKAHLAGEGRLVGVMQPNDGQCHMDGTPYYTKSLNYDFPSISYTNYIFQRERILPIFLATNESHHWYRPVASMMASASAKLLLLSANSDNVLTLLQTELSNLVSLARMIVLPQSGVNVSIVARCPGGVSPSVDPTTGFQQCTNLDFDKTAEFDITLTGIKCDTLASAKQVVLRVVGYGDIKVDVTPLCQCPCEANPDANSPFCSSQGSNKCGVCSCNTGFTDKLSNVSRCDCNTLDQATCIQKDETAVCSGRGDCVCQQCQCRKPAVAPVKGATYSGQYCECDNFNCPKAASGSICGASDGQGSCGCGKCQCSAGFTGDSCDCTTNTASCQPATGNHSRNCSGQGECVCGECRCDIGFEGTLCEKCAVEQCTRAAACFNCTTASGAPQGKCQKGCNGLNVTYSKEDNPTVLEQPAFQCTSPVPIELAGCSVTAFYAAIDTDCTKPFLEFVVKACPTTAAVNYIPVTVGPAVALIVIGLLLLALLKGFVYYRDRLEYKKFIKEAENSRAQGKVLNPIFKQARKVYVNPEYQGKPEKGRGEVEYE